MAGQQVKPDKQSVPQSDATSLVQQLNMNLTHRYHVYLVGWRIQRIIPQRIWVMQRFATLHVKRDTPRVTKSSFDAKSNETAFPN